MVKEISDTPRNGDTGLSFLNDIEKFFTDTEYLLTAFEALLNSGDAARRVLNIHAPSMGGKSALLTMFYLSCRSKGHHVALADARHAETPQDVLREIADQLEAGGISLPEYRKVLKIVLEDSVDAPKPWDSTVTETLAKRADTIGERIKPIGKPLIIELGLAGIEVIRGVVDVVLWRRKRKQAEAAEQGNRLKKRIKDEAVSEGTFKVLRKAFFKDIEKFEELKPEPRRSIVLLLDHLEELIDPEDQLRSWVSELVRDPNFLLVLAGRTAVGPEWAVEIPMQTEVLRPMDDKVIAELVQNYCKARAISAPSHAQIMNIVKFAAQVPYFALWAIEICREKKVDGWDIQKFLRLTPRDAAVIGARLESLLNQSTGSKSNEFSIALEAAAIVSWFNRDILKDLVGDLADMSYKDIEALPIVGGEGDYRSISVPVREVINGKLRSTDPKRYFELNQKASESYERRLKQLESDPHRMNNKQTLVLENLYHKYQFDTGDSAAALKAEQYFEDAFMDAFNRRQFSFCKSLLERVASFDTNVTGKNWVQYYSSLMNWYRRVDSDGARQVLEALALDATLDDNLLASVYESLGWINWYDNRLEDAKRYFERVLDLRERIPGDVTARVRIQVWQGIIFQRTEGAGEQYLKQALDLGDQLTEQAQGEKEREELAPILGWAHLELGNTFMLQGRFEEGRVHIDRSVHAFKRFALQFQHARALMTCGRLQLYQGKLKDAEATLKQSLSLYGDFNEPWSEAWADLSLGDVALRRGNLKQAQHHYTVALKKCDGDDFGTSVVKGGLAEVALALGDLKRARQTSGEALRLKLKLEDTFGIAWTLHTIGNVLLAKKRYSSAQHFFKQGVECARAGRSFLTESLLSLDMCRVSYFRDDDVGFAEAAKRVEELAVQYDFVDHLAHLQSLKASQRLRNLGKTSSGISEDKCDEVAEMFCESFTTALRHNVFLLDSLAEGMIETLQEYKQLQAQTGDFLQSLILRGVRSRWRRSPQSTLTITKTLHALEKSRRSAEAVDENHPQMLLDRLKKAA